MSAFSVQVAIALGSNLGNRLEYIRTAITTLHRSHKITVIDFSSVFESDAQTLDEHETQPSYLNAIVLVATSLSPVALLETCLQVESDNGRERQLDRRWEARTLDLDIILYGHEILNSESLKIPHPLLAQRRFVLQPLFEIRPDFHIPAPFDSSVRYLLAKCKDSSILKLHVSRPSLFSPDEFARPAPSLEQKR